MESTLTIRRPDDYHIHFRTGEMLKNVVPFTARDFARALVMPNIDPPILSGEAVEQYRQEILDVLPDVRLSGRFAPLMTFKVTPEITEADVRFAHAAGAIAGKLYPDGVTTGSAGGVRDFEALYPIFELMEELDLVLCLHGEHPDAECMDRERIFIDEVLYLISEQFPEMRIVLEHISTKAGVSVVAELHRAGHRIAGTLTVHHMELTHTDVFGGLLKPHLFCKPIAKYKQDRSAILMAATSGKPCFFFGSDSAPHPRTKKECAEGCAGVFSAPVALPLLAEIFERENALNKLEAFVSRYGAEFYGLPLNQGTITLKRKPWTVPQEYSGVVPYHAGDELAWQVVRD